ncbi:MAG: tetraacyldisaccharide 4'-kinase [Deltaproteobacteria bacterium]|nr:tetraacyldisaccharide 4'-kinase [Deltaproteobacteria bacterium]
MGLFYQNIEKIMNGPSGPDRGMTERALSLMSYIYGGLIRLRNNLYDRRMLPVNRLSCPVISVGNISAGGTGKTPMTVYIARMLRNRGLRPVIVSRGYGGEGVKHGAVVSDGNRLLCGPDISGDEPYLMASALFGVPVLVGADRFRSGSVAITRFSPSVIILDDGFQHRRLFRDVDLVLADDRKFLGNMRLIPRGMLREPVSSLSRADALILTRTGDTPVSIVRAKACAPGKSVFVSTHVPVCYGIFKGSAPLFAGIEERNKAQRLDVLRTARVFGFSGIAQNDEFLRTIKDVSGSLAGFVTFSDHHPYTDGELLRISQTAREKSADYIVTTRKDYVRAAGRIPGEIPVAVIDVEISFPGESAMRFAEFVAEKISEASLMLPGTHLSEAGDDA